MDNSKNSNGLISLRDKLGDELNDELDDEQENDPEDTEEDEWNDELDEELSVELIKELEDDFEAQNVYSKPDSSSHLQDESENYKKLDIRKGIETALHKIEAAGNFLACGHQDTAVNPGLYIPNIGSIRLPITAADAQAIIQCCSMSPYEKGTETSSNKAVRKIWQLDANQFSFLNDKWKGEVSRYVDQAVNGLGLTANSADISAEIYKLLIYEEGAFPLPHQDSQNVDGMFGTLVISLPSKHEGRYVTAYHKGKMLKFETAPNSEFGFSWGAWYSDVSYEVSPVLCGYRVVLVYNLIHRPSAVPLPLWGHKIEKLTEVLTLWGNGARDPGQYLDGWDSPDYDETYPSALVYVFEHQYSFFEVRGGHLKGVDQSRFAQLKAACEETGFLTFLANVERIDTGVAFGNRSDSFASPGGYHCMDDITDSKLELSDVVDGSGEIVGRDLKLPEHLLISSNPFSKEGPDEEDFEGFTGFIGNRGAPLTQVYKRTGALIMPKEQFFLLLLRDVANNKEKTIQYLNESRRIVQEGPEDKAARARLSQVCRMAMKLEASSEVVDFIMQGALRFANLELFRHTIDKCEGEFTPFQLTQIATAMFEHGIESLHPSVHKLFSNRAVNIPWASKGSFHTQVKLISRLMKEYHMVCQRKSQQPSAQILEWRNITFYDILSLNLNGSRWDGQKLVWALSACPAPGFVLQAADFMETLNKPEFVLSFICWVHRYSAMGKLDKDEAVLAIDRLLLPVIMSFNRDHQRWILYRYADEFGFPDLLSSRWFG